MPRMKKDGEHINAKIDREAYEMLESFCQKTHLPKTTVLELAIKHYVSQGTTKTDNGLSVPKII